MSPIEDHPMRFRLANELHARPFPTVSVPATAVYLAIKQPEMAVGRDRSADHAHLADLLGRNASLHPEPGATHFSGQIGRHMLKWEQHTEFVTYTAFSERLAERAFDPTDFEIFPDDWLCSAPGARMTSILMRIMPRVDDQTLDAKLNEWFVPESLAVARVLDDAAVVASDFRIDPAGHMRFAVFASPETGFRRVGRIVQRLCEIETYKSMSMLGFARSGSLGSEIGKLDAKVSDLIGEMTSGTVPADETLAKLLAISSELEAMGARSSFRFGATGAYEAIVNQRIEALREERFLGRPTFSEFMSRRYQPAMRTVKSTQSRLDSLANRAMRAGDLLRTRVDVERSAQNQSLLESMDRRADLQLRLQHTVEGLSVVAISYYAVSLASYLLYPLTETTGLSKGMLTAFATVPVVLLVWYMIRRIKQRLE